MKKDSTKAIVKVSDEEYIRGLRAGDAQIINSFFYHYLGYLLNDIRVSLMNKRLTYDDLVNELYLYLAPDNFKKFDSYAGINGCTLRGWMSRLTWRYFIHERKRLLGLSSEDIEDLKVADETPTDLDIEITMDVEMTFVNMSNQRYADVLRWMLDEGYDAQEVAQRLNTTVSNVYNIKHRAIVQFVETYTGCK